MIKGIRCLGSNVTERAEACTLNCTPKKIENCLIITRFMRCHCQSVASFPSARDNSTCHTILLFPELREDTTGGHRESLKKKAKNVQHRLYSDLVI